MTKFGVIGVLFFGAALAFQQSTVNAQTGGIPSDETANHRGLSERKVRVVLPSPYQQIDIISKAIRPAASNESVVTKPAIAVVESPSSKPLTFGQPVQDSTFMDPPAPLSSGALSGPLKQVNAPIEHREVGKHDLNSASLADLNSLEGGGLIGRAIIAGRPYRSPDELVMRRILSRTTYERIKAQVSVRSSGKY